MCLPATFALVLKRVRSLVAVGSATVVLVGGLSFSAGSVSAAIDPMDPPTLQQMVLRVQFPTTWGSWSQNLYGTEAGWAPTVCYGASGPIALTKAKVVGFIGYQTDSDHSGTVSIFQYADKAKAAKALAALRQADCDGAPLVPTEAERLVTAVQEYGKTNSNNTGLSSSMTYVEPGEGVRGYISTLSTQRGLAIVQTTVSAYAQTPQTMEQQQVALNQVSSVNSTWHGGVLKAYKNFGVDGIAR